VLLRCSMQVSATASTVFACVDEPQNIVQWVGGIVEHQYVTARDEHTAVGQRFRQLLRQGRTVREFNGEIIVWEAPSHFGLRIPSAAYTSEAHFRISADGPTRSTVRYSLEIRLHSPTAKLLGPLLKLPLWLFVRQQISRLKAYAEKLQGSLEVRD